MSHEQQAAAHAGSTQNSKYINNQKNIYQQQTI
jgi:hypothetical protein